MYREFNSVDNTHIPEGTAIVSREKLGKFAIFNEGMGYLSSNFGQPNLSKGRSSSETSRG